MVEKPQSVNEVAISTLRDAVRKLGDNLPGTPAMEIPLDSLHFYHDQNGETRCVIDAEQVLFLADMMFRKIAQRAAKVRP